MRKETVPIDMSSEQKTILGFISKRQLIYIVAGGALLYAYVPMVFKLFPNFIIGGVAALISAIPTLIVVFIFAFWKKQKLHLNFDQYIMIKISYKGQIGIWRKGSKPKDWMVK
ncbi:PrgI family mobile element protein [Robertmurraya sp. FSL R5-0851]|uniref:PrgI family mobile element protein n=1 Tax=Robertmurraya sp. FSL R5-0851 TaxID=2921584 RepID=UPI0030F77835